MGVWEMPKYKQKLSSFRMQTSSHFRLVLIAAAALVLFSQSSCLFKKNKKVAVTPPTGIRLAILPFNVPLANQDLRWTALAAPIMMAKVSESARDLEVIPLWETMPVAIEAGGASRSFTPETAAYVASWFSAKWSAMGEISPTKSGVSMMIDFMPSRTTLVPFRFTRDGKIDAIGTSLPEAYSQFLRYLAARPLLPAKKDLQQMTAMKNLAEALDREYGWFVAAEPGKAQGIVSELARTDERLARLLFNPTVYPVLAQAK
jgi:hypothetical protein